MDLRSATRVTPHGHASTRRRVARGPPSQSPPRSVRQLQPSLQRLEARVAPNAGEQRVDLQPRYTAIALPPGALQPCERFLALPAPGVNLGDLVRGLRREAVDRFGERAVRGGRVTECMF